MNLFTSYFNALNQTEISYAVTGRIENYPKDIHSDIDIIIPNNQFHLFWIFMSDINKQQMNWIQAISHEITAHYCIVKISDGINHNFIKPDVCSNYYRKGILFLEADFLLKGRILNTKGFYQLACEKEYIYYLIKKIDKGGIDKAQFNHLRDKWTENKRLCLEISSLFFPKECQQIISDAFEKNDQLHLINNLITLKKGLHHNLTFSIKDFLLKVKNRIIRIIQPTGLVIAVMGPDGCGKTTIINHIESDLTDVFRQSKIFHLYPLPQIDSTIVQNPHSLKPRGLISSILKLIYYLFLYTIGFWFIIYPLKIKSTFVIFDRYYHDILIDPYRYRQNCSLFWTKLIGFFIPKPDLWILLDAPFEIIQQRKSEVSAAETERQLIAYRKLFANLKNAFIVNANQPIQTVGYEVEQKITEYIQTRTFKRYKNI